MTVQINHSSAHEKFKPLAIELKGEAGKRVFNAAVKRVLQRHAKEIKALADK